MGEVARLSHDAARCESRLMRALMDWAGKGVRPPEDCVDLLADVANAHRRATRAEALEATLQSLPAHVREGMNSAVEVRMRRDVVCSGIYEWSGDAIVGIVLDHLAAALKEAGGG